MSIFVDHVQRKIDEAFRERTTPELCLGFVRYEFMRRLKPNSFNLLYQQAFISQRPFDDLVDELIEAEGKMNER